MSFPTSIHTAPERFIQLYSPNLERTHTEISAGLLAERPFISPKFFYNRLGSKLFEAICDLPEYYLTRTEAALFEDNSPQICRSIGQGKILIDLGAGNCTKAAQLFSYLEPAQYIPIDISVEFLKDSVTQLQFKFPKIRMLGLGMDFSSSLHLPPEIEPENRLFFYPGSSIGNFTPTEALELLKSIHQCCANRGSLFIGIDLIKDKEILESAYNDSLGITAAFNLNVLNNMNSIIQSNFRTEDWIHRSFYNPQLCRIEMHLEARHSLNVRWKGGQRKFKMGQTIQTESSYKYHPNSFIQLLELAGFQQIRTWIDTTSGYMLCHAKAQYEH